MIYEFECAKGHVIEAHVPMGTKQWPCTACLAEAMATNAVFAPAAHLATRILSATKTTFVFADTCKRIKHIQRVAARGH